MEPWKIDVLKLSRCLLLVCGIAIFASLQNDNINAITLGENVSIINSSGFPLEDTKYNIIAAGDWYCNKETEVTIDNVINANPDLIISTGDHVKNVKSADCWTEMSGTLEDKMKIALGNHDIEFKKIYKQIANHHQLINPYYSYDFQNIHFIAISTEHPFKVGSTQYQFIRTDLEKASKDPNIDWIIIYQHKPLYSTNQDKKEANDLRDVLQPIFHKYDVDLVLSGHNQYYERTYPILYNKTEELLNDKSDKPNPIVTNNHAYEYPPTDGIVFLSVGTAGDKLDPVRETHNYHVTQQSKYGFLNLELSDQGKKLTGKFYTNDGKVIDNFILHER